MKFITAIFTVVFFLISAPIINSASASVGITAVIGNHAISTIDIMEHANALRIMYNVKDINQATWKELAQHAVNDLTDSIILEGKAIESGWTIYSAELDMHMNNLYKTLGMTKEEFVQYAERNKVNLESLVLSMRVRILWSRALKDKVESKINAISSREIADFAATMKRNLITLNTIYTLRYANINTNQFNSNPEYERKITGFIKKLHSCSEVDNLAPQFGLPPFSSELESTFHELSPPIQAALVTMEDSLHGTVVTLKDSLQLIAVCSFDKKNIAPSPEIDTNQARNIIMQHKRAQLTHQVMTKMRNTRFIEVREIPEYRDYINLYPITFS